MVQPKPVEVRIKLTKEGALLEVHPSHARAERGAEVTWKVDGRNNASWIVIGAFRPKTRRTAPSGPMSETFVGIGPGPDIGPAQRTVSVREDASEQVYEYTVRVVPLAKVEDLIGRIHDIGASGEMAMVAKDERWGGQVASLPAHMFPPSVLGRLEPVVRQVAELLFPERSDHEMTAEIEIRSVR